LAGVDSIFDAVCRQAGIIRVDDMDQLFHVGAALVNGIRPKGRRVGIVTGGGGWGVLASDACARAGLEVAELPEETLRELDTFLPSWWSRSNPVDLVAGLRPGDAENSLETMLRCPNVDGVILLGLSGPMPSQADFLSVDIQKRREMMDKVLDDIAGVFDRYNDMADSYGKPIIVAAEPPFAGGYRESKMLRKIGERGGVCYSLPEHAALVFSSVAGYAEYLRRSDLDTEARPGCAGR
jgi:acetyltransferase